MDTQILAIYGLCDDLLRAMDHRDDAQCQMSDAQIMTTATVAALYFSGNFALSCRMLYEQRYMPRMLSASRFNRRLHRVKPLFLSLFALLGETFKQLNDESVYVVDSFPIAACDNYRIRRSRRYRGEEYRGYVASPNRYGLSAFYELHVWAWQSNPNGMFADFNPQVSCEEYVAAGAMHGSHD